MNTEKRSFKHGELTEKIIGIFYDVYNELGSGFLEAIYRNDRKQIRVHPRPSAAEIFG